jgi:hypothetical protein
MLSHTCIHQHIRAQIRNLLLNTIVIYGFSLMKRKRLRHLGHSMEKLRGDPDQFCMPIKNRIAESHLASRGARVCGIVEDNLIAGFKKYVRCGGADIPAATH